MFTSLIDGVIADPSPLSLVRISRDVAYRNRANITLAAKNAYQELGTASCICLGLGPSHGDGPAGQGELTLPAIPVAIAHGRLRPSALGPGVIAHPRRCHRLPLISTLLDDSSSICKTPEALKSWSQNLGHEGVLITLTAYGAVSPSRQTEIILGLGREEAGQSSDTKEIFEELGRRLGYMSTQDGQSAADIKETASAP